MTLYEICYDSLPNMKGANGTYVLTKPVKVWDNLANKARTITAYDFANFLFSSDDNVWFMGSDTHFSLEETPVSIADADTQVGARSACTCDIVSLIQVGCKCGGV